MSKNNVRKEITVAKTWKGEIINFDIPYDIYISNKNKILEEGGNGFDSKQYNKSFKFASFETEEQKILYVGLPSPGERYIEKTPEQRKKTADDLRKIMKNTEEGRKKKFLERRKDIIEQLAKEEKNFGIITTESKLEEYLKLKAKYGENTQTSPDNPSKSRDKKARRNPGNSSEGLKRISFLGE